MHNCYIRKYFSVSHTTRTLHEFKAILIPFNTIHPQILKILSVFVLFLFSSHKREACYFYYKTKHNSYTHLGTVSIIGSAICGHFIC